MTDPALQRAAGLAALAAAVVGLLYSVSFVVVSRLSAPAGGFLSALFLLVGGLLTIVALAGVYDRRREALPALALLVVVVGSAGALGAAGLLAILAYAALRGDFAHATFNGGTFGAAAVGRLIFAHDALAAEAVAALVLAALAGATAAWRVRERERERSR